MIWFMTTNDYLLLVYNWYMALWYTYNDLFCCVLYLCFLWTPVNFERCNVLPMIVHKDDCIYFNSLQLCTLAPKLL